jgi:two-component system cell cycle sensor histidine kinase/response regulator CckA
VVGSDADITTRKQAEIEKMKLESQLQSSQKMEAIGTLAGGIAHDFNNLLMGIQGRTSLMLIDTDLPQLHYEELKGIEDIVKSAAGLTKQLLGFARTGKYEVKPADMNELIHKSSQMFGRTNREIKIHTKYQESIWSVEVDRSQIEQVLLNLYVNAWQAMPGGGELYLQTENVMFDESYSKPYKLSPGKYVKISVTDTGVGMDEATQERIFEPFFTTKKMGRGIGLGLASTYGIIKNHDGIINVFSQKGEGTTFEIYLPASEKEVVEEKKLPEAVLKGTETVLFVDDEDMIVGIGKKTLKRMGYDVITAKNGKEAIELYKENKARVDIVVLDMIMPEMGGGETYDKLKEINPSVRVLLSSGYSIEGQASEILKRGCDGFIQKPFRMRLLSRKIREVLDKE